MKKQVEVSAAILLREGKNGTEYLLAQRPEGKVYAGYWEFPGGKVEPGETFKEALIRELNEEMGIHITDAWPWLSCDYDYPHAQVRLKFFRTQAWDGEIAALEHSGMAWTPLHGQAAVEPILPANGPILRALSLPETYAITNAEENGVESELARVQQGLQNGIRLIQVRDKALPSETRYQFAKTVVELAKAYPHAQVLINNDIALAQAIGADGVHLPSDALRALATRPDVNWLAASCHTAEEIDQAIALGADFITLSPVLATPTHPTAKTLGWAAFSQLTDRLPIPVYALGGMQHKMLAEALNQGAHGLALMRGW